MCMNQCSAEYGLRTGNFEFLESPSSTSALTYGVKLRLLERWAIIAYMRTLQKSQIARLEDVPLDMRKVFLQ